LLDRPRDRGGGGRKGRRGGGKERAQGRVETSSGGIEFLAGGYLGASRKMGGSFKLFEKRLMGGGGGDEKKGLKVEEMD